MAKHPSYSMHTMLLALMRIAILALLTLLLTNCMRAKKSDGPPRYHVDVSKIRNAVPKPEPLSKYGNMPSYRVFGKRYYTLKSSKHYDRVGIASWYGTKFHAHRTSSGEPYNMLAMTAAHKTLPLPTYVEVTNLKNKRKIIVKVNDRGPFAANRIIDLSYVAARKLGMTGHGTARVRVRAINPYTYAAKKPRYHKALPPVKSLWPPSNKPSFVYLQVGAFRNKLNAERLKQRLASIISAPVRIAKPTQPGKLYRVHVGPIRDTATANKITHHLKGLGINANTLNRV